jgi:hypothetical protein
VEVGVPAHGVLPSPVYCEGLCVCTALHSILGSSGHLLSHITPMFAHGEKWAASCFGGEGQTWRTRFQLTCD